MRAHVEPPPSSRCDLCGGELLLKRVETANRTLELDSEIFICIKCGREQSYTVIRNHYTPDPKVA
jgi:DNA-directed RNA polymerase subunit RPC12/RpoP